MKVPYYRREDCGHEFERTDLQRDVEDDLLTCPDRGGLDLEIVTAPAA
jgi:hypothetical protein